MYPRLIVVPLCLVLAGISRAQPTWTADRDEAFRQSSELGCPLLVLVTGAGCGPCQAMKQELGRLEGDEAEIVVLEFDVHGAPFQAFRQTHPHGFTGSIPMVYVIDAQGAEHHAQPGLIPPDRLRRLLQAARRAAGPPLDPKEVAGIQQTLAEVRRQARGGHLLEAWKLLKPISRHKGSAAVIQLGRKYEGQLASAIESIAVDLDRKLGTPSQAHAAAVHLAVLYVQTSDLPSVHSVVGEILTRRGEDAPTRDAVLQAKFLVRAHVAEQRQLRDEAIISYTHILRIDHESPIGLVAATRLPGIRSAPRVAPRSGQP